jgi:NifU-like protein involved in Fe-S cluster formation
MEDILREILLDHVKNPKNKKELDNPDLSGHSNNPVCGDVVKVDLQIENDTVIDVASTVKDVQLARHPCLFLAKRLKVRV